MTIYVAFYKGRKGGKGIKVQLARLADWAIRQATGGIYSHCEIAVALGDGRFECYSASLRDGGVRRKLIHLTPDKWDLIELPEVVAEQARALYRKTLGAKYDTWGVFATVLPRVRGSRNKWFCSEWCAVPLGLPQPEKYSPNRLAKRFQAASKQ